MSSFTNPIASFSSTNFTPDRLVISVEDVLSKGITILTGQANLKRGSLLGQITIGTASVAANGGGALNANTGNGTCVLDASPILANARTGAYTLMCTVAGANSATFRLTDPAGRVLGDYAFNGAGASVTVADQIKCVLTDAGTDFIVGDGFKITVAAGSGKYVLSVATATDGSAVPDAILVEDTDATAGDMAALGYYAGTFNTSSMTFGTGQTAANTFEVLREKGIYLPPAPIPAAF